MDILYAASSSVCGYLASGMLFQRTWSSYSRRTNSRPPTENTERTQCKLLLLLAGSWTSRASNNHIRQQMFFKRLYLDHEEPVIKKQERRKKTSKFSELAVCSTVLCICSCFFLFLVTSNFITVERPVRTGYNVLAVCSTVSCSCFCFFSYSSGLNRILYESIKYR